MTEAEWLGCKDPNEMLDWLRGRTSARKFRLVCVASCERAKRYTEPHYHEPAEIAAAILAGTATAAQMRAVYRKYPPHFDHDDRNAFANTAGPDIEDTAPRSVADLADWIAHCRAVYDEVPEADYEAEKRARLEEELALSADQVREVVGNPFRPVRLEHLRLSEEILGMARLAAADFDPVRLAVLSDALEETGCAEAALLSHLRSPGPHVRGCWALELILGKG